MLAVTSDCSDGPSDGLWDGSDELWDGSNELWDGLGEEKEDGWFDAFVPREIALEPEEDEVEDESVHQSCENKCSKSESHSSPEIHCSI